jgi:hypothetical protein
MSPKRRNQCSHLARPALALVLLAASAALQAAGNLDFLKDSPLMHFRQDDYDLMIKNAVAVLDAAGDKATESWRNPQTGASGLAQVRTQFTTKGGMLCKQLRVVNRARGIDGEATYTVCKSSDRGWVLAADARPAH